MNAIRNFFQLLIACASLNAATIPPTPNQYFNDYAGVIAAPSVAFFNDLLARFERETSNQIVVAIYSKLNPDTTPEQFGKEAFSAWKPGQSERNNGVLVLLFLDDRKVRIQTGSGLEKVLPDKLCAEIIATDMGPNFRKGDYTDGIEAALNHIINTTRNAYKGDGHTAAEKYLERQQADADQDGRDLAQQMVTKLKGISPLDWSGIVQKAYATHHYPNDAHKYAYQQAFEPAFQKAYAELGSRVAGLRPEQTTSGENEQVDEAIKEQLKLNPEDDYEFSHALAFNLGTNQGNPVWKCNSYSFKAGGKHHSGNVVVEQGKITYSEGF